MTRERPILFSAPMVRAILEGRKTMTRRVIKPQPFDITGCDDFGINCISQAMENTFIKFPYGEIGNRLWVKEKWRVGAWDQDYGRIAVDYAASPDLGKTPWCDVENEDTFERLWVQSSDDAMAAGLPMGEEGAYHWEPGRGPCRWRPSIFMPRWASRITLEITNVRVECLQDISEADAKAEGCDHFIIRDRLTSYVDDYKNLWNRINGPGSWDANPWVWVIEFKRVQI